MTEYRDDVYMLQMWLSALHCAGEDIPAVTPTGHYDKTTAEAVSAFQKENGVEPTGVVDYETWSAIKSAYENMRAARAEPVGVKIFPSPSYVLKKGEKSDVALCVQMMLSALCVAYDEFDDVEKSGVYDETTAACVREFQKINGIEPTGEVDRTTWDRLARNYNTFANHPGYVC